MKMSSAEQYKSSEDLAQLLVKQLFQAANETPESLPRDNTSDNVDIKKLVKIHPNQRAKTNNFYEITIPSYTPEEFRLYFRMSRGCFARIMEKMAKKVMIYNMEKKFLFTIWMLSTRESFCAVGQRFGFAKGAAYQYFCEIIDGLIALFKQHVSWPSDTEFSHIEQGFKPKTGGYVPGIIGAIDGCHIQIKKPSRYSIYANRRNTHSVILQAVCDHQRIFTDVYVGAPGCLHADRVFRNSPLSKEMTNLIPEDYHIVGNPYYPSLKNLVVPFVDEGMLTETQMLFNECLMKATSTIEQAFRLLLARFRRLTYLDTSKPELANKMVCSCVVLHNHILMTDPEDNYDDLLQEESDVYLNADAECINTGDDDCEGMMKRNYLLSLFEFI